MSGVDVLAVMDEVLRRVDEAMPTPLDRPGESCMHPAHHAGYAHDIRKARAAVAELIKCSDVTVKAFEVLGRSNGVVDQIESHRNCEGALIEQKAALARINGGAE